MQTRTPIDGDKHCRNWCGRLEPLADFEVPHARFASRAEPMAVRHSSLFGMAVGLLVGFGLPYLEVARACLRPISEGCVWGRSLIAVNIIATLILVGLPVGVLTAWWAGRRN
jgi:uncharacterized membrane protein (DUF441 family)